MGRRSFRSPRGLGLVAVVFLGLAGWGSADALADLRTFPFEAKIASLEGQWDFLWGQLDPNAPPDGHSLRVPGNWNQQVPQYPAEGAGTYRLRVRLPDTGHQWALRFSPANSASRLFINGRAMAKAGLPSLDPSTEVPQLLPQLVFFDAPGGDIDLAIEVSNWNYRKGGLWTIPTLGTAERMRADDDQRLLRDFVLIGLFLSIAFYHLAHTVFVALRRRQFRAAGVWVLLLCLSLLGRALATDDQLGARLLGWDWEWARRLEFFPMNFSALLAYGLMRSLYPEHLRPGLGWILIGGGLVLGVPLLLPGRVSNHFVEVWELFMVVYLALGLSVPGRAARHRVPGALAILLGMAAMLLAAVHDSLSATYGWKAFESLYPLTLFLFLVILTFEVAQRADALEQRVDLLSNNLQELRTLLQRFVPVGVLPDLMLLCDSEGKNVQMTEPLQRLLGSAQGTDLLGLLGSNPRVAETWAALRDGQPRFGVQVTLAGRPYGLSFVPTRDQFTPGGRVLVRFTAQEDLDAAFDRFGLSPREREVCLLLFEGLSNADIARRLFVSQSTIKTHLQNLFRKTQTSTRVGLLVALSPGRGASEAP